LIAIRILTMATRTYMPTADHNLSGYSERAAELAGAKPTYQRLNLDLMADPKSSKSFQEPQPT